MPKPRPGGQSLLRQPVFHLFCALIFSGIFNWPVMTGLLSFAPLTTFFVVFAAWALAIPIQFFISRALADRTVATDDEEPKRGPAC